MLIMCRRLGFRWNINECLQLQREYELLGLSIDEIADIHQRTPNAIMHKLDEEGFANYNQLYAIYYHSKKDPNFLQNNEYDEYHEYDDDDDDYQDDDDDDSVYDSYNIKQHVKNLQSQLNYLTDIVYEISSKK